MTEPATEQHPSARRPHGMIALIAALMTGVLATYWLVARARAKSIATDVLREARELDGCIAQAGELELAFSDDALFGPCAPMARALADSATTLAAAALVREPERVSALADGAARTAQFPWSSRAGALDPQRVTALRSGVSALLRTACEVGVAQGAASPDDCTAAPRPGRRTPQVVLDAELDRPPAEVVWTATSARAPGGRSVALLAVAARAGEQVHAWLARSFDAGKSWQTTAIEPALQGASSAPRVPDVALLAGGALEVGRFAADGEGVWQARLSRWDPDAARAVTTTPEAVAIPDGYAPVSAGSAIVPTSAGRVALALVRTSDGTGAIWHPTADAEAPRPTPVGRLLAATAAPPARVLLARRSNTGFVELAEVAVPAADQPWPAPTTTLVSYVSELEVGAGPDRWCGLPGEQYFTLLGRGPDHQVLVAAGPKQIYPYRFSTRASSDIRVLCGPCPPAALERSREGLRVFLPVRRQLAPASVQPPLAFDPKSAESADAACSGQQVAVAYVAKGRLLAQSTRAGTWRFQRPVALARPDGDAKLVDVRALGFDQSVLVLWRRAAPQGKRLRIEALAIGE